MAIALFASTLLAAPGYVQGNCADPQTPQTTVKVPFTAAQTSGNLNVIIVGWGDTTATVGSVTDTMGKTYVLAVGPTKYSTTLTQSIYYAKNIASATANQNVVTVKFSVAAIYPDVKILEYTGINPNNPLDVTAASFGTGTTSLNSLVTSNATDMLVAANTVTEHTSGPGSGFTNRGISDPGGNIVEERLVTSVGSYSATASLNRTSGWVMQTVALRAARSPNPTATPTLTPTATLTPMPVTVPAPTPKATPVPTPTIKPAPPSGNAHFIRAGATGATNGSDWNNAWANWSAINWSLVNPGDTIYVAAGTYSGQLTIGKSGASGAVITIERVLSTDAAATIAAGWKAAYDGQVVQTVAKGSGGIYINNGLGSFVTVDGRINAGWRINISDNSSGASIDGSGASNVTFRYIQVNGPGVITETGDVRGFDLTPTGSMPNLTVSHCEVLNGCDAAMYLTKANNALVEYCSFHGQDSLNPETFHTNVVYSGTITNSTFRYNKMYDIQVEGLFFGDPGNQNILIYRNLFYQGSVPNNSGRAIQFDSGSSGNRGIRVYNNTFVGLPLGVQLAGSSTFSGCVFENNIVYGCSLTIGPGWTSNFNFFSDSTTEANSIGKGSNPFVNYRGFDYHIVGTIGATYPRSKGASLGTPYNSDMDGDTRPSSGAWDIGAYEFSN